MITTVETIVGRRVVLVMLRAALFLSWLVEKLFLKGADNSSHASQPSQLLEDGTDVLERACGTIEAPLLLVFLGSSRYISHGPRRHL
jgi:hypothetical protein